MFHQSMSRLIRSTIGKYYQYRSHLLLKHSLTVFCFHEVSEIPSRFCKKYELNVVPQIFDYQIRFIKKNFNIITPDELLKNHLPKNAAMITFDDGFLSFFEIAIPILKKNHVPALIFLNMAPIQGAVFWSGLITYLCNERLEFVRYIKDILGPDLPEPLFLHCSKEIVLGYLKKVQYNFGTEVENYIGEFANENHLEIAAENKFIYFGNHLYNHYVPKLMTDEDLIDCFEKNVNALKKYKNYRNLFSFPFGQPNSCFTGHQVSLLRDRFSTQIFASSQRINYNLEFPLDRISLTTEHNSPTKIWFETFKHRVRDQIYWPSTS
jgi:peptidoglycan/xylan/chitin deacetylase (PgdA/CDA1 family)